MFVDDVSGIGLWETLATDELEAALPITEDLRQRIRAWVDEYTASFQSRGRAWAMRDDIEHDHGVIK